MMGVAFALFVRKASRSSFKFGEDKDLFSDGCFGVSKKFCVLGTCSCDVLDLITVLGGLGVGCVWAVIERFGVGCVVPADEGFGVGCVGVVNEGFVMGCVWAVTEGDGDTLFIVVVVIAGVL